tara:strand:- start:207 stop:683 length:477 start_codon:yes stop_codon:yes gene_type:complete
MRSDTPTDKRTYEHRKTIPETGKLRSKKTTFNRNSVLKKAGYRSQFELNLARILTDNGVSFEYETIKFQYIPQPRNYTPDFYLTESNIYVEAKGHLTKDDRVKMILVKKQHPELDIRFVFVRAHNKIYKGSKTTYASWCERHGFQWAEGSIPTDWYKK